MNVDLPEVDINRILYVTDLSENARYAMAYAVSLANTYGAQIVILHVIEEASQMDEDKLRAHIRTEDWEEIQKTKKRYEKDTREVLIGKKRDNAMIREALDRFCRNLRPGTDDHEAETDETVVKHGNPVTQILATAKEKRCDMIVMGAHGLGGLLDAMMGSTASRVLRRSKVPVLVVRLPESD